MAAGPTLGAVTVDHIARWRRGDGEVVLDAQFLGGRQVQPGMTPYVWVDRQSAGGCPFSSGQLQHCKASKSDCKKGRRERQRVLAAHDHLLVHPYEELEAVARSYSIGRVVDRCQPYYQPLQQLTAEAVLAWRKACGENAVQLCWCWPKGCHATANGRHVEKAARWSAERLPGIPEEQRADGPPAELLTKWLQSRCPTLQTPAVGEWRAKRANHLAKESDSGWESGSSADG